MNLPRLLLISAVILFPAESYAYLDPGTGSIILQGLIAGLAAAAVTGKMYWHKIKSLFGLNKDSEEQQAKESEKSE